jgi:hypothetical protein
MGTSMNVLAMSCDDLSMIAVKWGSAPRTDTAFLLPDPAMPDGWKIVRREHLEDGEHVWHLRNHLGGLCRWLEDEGAIEWAQSNMRGL